jgi:monomeric sarcosine oxidase
MNNTYNIIIVGAGVMGSATAYYLSKKKKNILVVDQYEVKNAVNASQDYSRVFRYVYGTDRYYPGLAAYALKLWKRLEKESDTQVYFPCGCLLLGNAPESYAAKSYATMKAMKLPIRKLEGAQFAKAYPQFRIDAGILDPHGGVIEANTATDTFLTLAQKNGVEVQEKTKVAAIGQKSIQLENGQILHADTVVVTAGSWVKKLLSDDVKVTPSRQEIIYIRPKNTKLFQKNVFPAFGHLESGFYGIPIHKINAVKIANHNPGPTVDADRVDKTPSKAFLKECRAFLKQYIPDLADGTVVKTKVCLYDMTPSEDFVIDRLNDTVVVGAGFSGHGFKFASAIGESLAALALGTKPAYDIDRFSLAKNT